MNCQKSKPMVLLVYGEGGHEEQMRRLVQGMELVDTDKFIVLTDSNKQPDWCKHYYQVGEVRDKHKVSLFSSITNSLKIISTLFTLKKRYSIGTIISTGPGVSIISGTFFKYLFGVKIIHIETWSRFYTRSLTGRAMYFLSDIFYVQNEELLQLFPKAKFSGRL